MSPAIAVGVNTLNPPTSSADDGTFGKGGRLGFTPPPFPRDVDAMSYPQGYTDHVIIRWGNRLFNSTPNFTITTQSAKAQTEQCGYNRDHLYLKHPAGGR